MSVPSPSKSNKEPAKGPITRGRKASESSRAPAEAASKHISSKKIMEVAIARSPTTKRKVSRGMCVLQWHAEMEKQDNAQSKTVGASKTDKPWFASSTSSEEDQSEGETNDSEKGNVDDDESEGSEAEVIVRGINIRLDTPDSSHCRSRRGKGRLSRARGAGRRASASGRKQVHCRTA